MGQPGDLFYMVRVPASPVDEALQQVEIPEGIRQTLVPARNLHQSCSVLQPPRMRGAMIDALASIDTAGFRLELNRLASSRKSDAASAPRWLLRLVGPESKPAPFRQLLHDLATATRSMAIGDAHTHTAHVSVSYFADASLAATLARPVFVPVDHVELVAIAGRGRDYRYETIYRKALGPEVPRATQASLF